MGQRLNIEITNDGEVLANAYYHWSGYTSSSLALTRVALDAYRKTKEILPLRIAVDILQETGAGVSPEERAGIKKDTTGRFDGITFNGAISRNGGLLAVTRSGIESTRSWEEGRVTIDIGSEEFIFDVMCIMGNEEYDEGREPGSAKLLPDTPFDFNQPHAFKDFAILSEVVRDNPAGVRLDDDNVICWIE